MPPYVALARDVLVVLGWLAIFFVFKENTFTFATIELASDQKVISTGPYALVRHPMYAGALVMLLGIPIALGSWWGLLVIVAMMPALIWRLGASPLRLLSILKCCVTLKSRRCQTPVRVITNKRPMAVIVFIPE